jgi:hypothetical protein
MKNSMRISAVCFLLILALGSIGCSGPEAAKKSDAKTASTNDAASKWEGALIKRPAGPSVEDGKVYLVRGGKRCWVLSVEWLKLHGYKFPDDVKEIPAEELASIPLGEEIH